MLSALLNMLEKDPQARIAPNLLMNGNQHFYKVLMRLYQLLTQRITEEKAGLFVSQLPFIGISSEVGCTYHKSALSSVVIQKRNFNEL